MNFRKAFVILASIGLAALHAHSAEILPDKGRSASALTLHYVSAPMGLHALMYGARRIALFDDSGRDIDIVWRKPARSFLRERKGAFTEIRTEKHDKIKPMSFRFDENGFLAALTLEDEKKPERTQKTFFPRVKNPLRSYWDGVTASEGVTLDYWKASGRLRLGYSNPNASGALFAEISVLLLAGLLFLRPLWCRITSGVLLAGSFAALILTESRGSFLGFCLGALIVALFTPGPMIQFICVTTYF